MKQHLIKRHLPLALATLVLMGAALPASAEDAPKGPREGGFGKDRGAKMFEAADANKDGELTKDEMMGAHQQRIDKMFGELDTDKNGTLSKPELENGRDKMREAMKERLKDRKTKGGPEGGAEPGPEAGPAGGPLRDGPPPADHNGDKPE